MRQCVTLSPLCVFRPILLAFFLPCLPIRVAGAGDGRPTRRDDEPNELSWEHFSTCVPCFEDFRTWAMHDEAAWSEALAAGRSAGMVEPPPAAFAGVWLEAEAFSETGPVWTVVKQPRLSGKQLSGSGLLKGLYGHNSAFTRLRVRVPEAGRYRLWARYWHLQGYHASFRARILPAEMSDYAFSWQVTSRGEWLNHRFDFAERGRKQPLLSRKDEPTGFVWESTPLVELPGGEACLELAGCIHDGPYTFRQVDCLVLWQDPLGVPVATAGPEQGALRSLSPRGFTTTPSDATLERWGLWCLRPGVLPLRRVPATVSRLWERWRRDLVARLADGSGTGLHQGRLARQVIFDERWNLIGTPAQIREETERLRAAARGPGVPWYRVIEAESMREDIPGWTPENDSVSGGGVRMRAHYCDGRAEASAQVEIPHPGRFRLWVHHSRIKAYTNIFQVRLEPVHAGAATETTVETAYGEEPADAGGYRMVWTGKDVELTAGAYRVVLAKDRGKGPYGYRHVDRIMLIDGSDWVPEGLAEPNVSPGEIRAWTGERRASLAVWRQEDLWQGFDMTASRPGEGDELMPESLTLSAASGETVSALLHLANPASEAVTLAPSLDGSAAGRFSWRLVAYVLSKRFGWQPMPLLHRRQVTVPPCCTASLWLTLNAAGMKPGRHHASLRLGDLDIGLVADVEPLDLSAAPWPLVGGWTRPYASRAAWETFSDVGINLIHGAMLPREEMSALGLKLFNVTLGSPEDADAVREVVAATRAMGLAYTDWSWEVFDEPTDKTADRWAVAAESVRNADRDVRLWCNPGDANVCRTEAVRTMAPFIDVFCPFINHFHGWPDAAHAAFVVTVGKTALFYTTPCSAEKAPHAPKDMLRLGEEALRLGRHGWDFFCLKNYYEYCNSPWDDVYAYHRDQAVSIYPGAWRQAISTRNLEALRESIRLWRRAEAP